MRIYLMCVDLKLCILVNSLVKYSFFKLVFWGMPLLTDACTSCPRLCRFFASWILLSEVSWFSSVKFLTGNWKAKELHSCCVHVKSCGTNLEGTFHGLVVLRHEAIYEEVNEELSNLKHHCNGDTEVEGYGTAQGGYVWSIWPLNEVMIMSDF